MSKPSSWLRLRARQAGAVLLGLLVFVPRVSAHVHLTLAQHNATHGHQHGPDHGHSHPRAQSQLGEHNPHPAEDHLEAEPETLLLEVPEEAPFLWWTETQATPLVLPVVRGARPCPVAEPRPPPPRSGAPPRAPPISS